MTSTVTRTQAELTNARARIVGEREGAMADAIVWIVRTTSVVGRAIARVGSAGSAPGTGPAVPARPSRALVYSLVACAVLVVVLGVTAAIVLVRAGASDDIPTVRDLSGRVDGSTVVFSWSDPGLQSGDVYQVTVDDQPPASQRTSEFRVDARAGQTVCVTVTVNRDGKTGSASGEKCVERSGGS